MVTTETSLDKASPALADFERVENDATWLEASKSRSRRSRRRRRLNGEPRSCYHEDIEIAVHRRQNLTSSLAISRCQCEGLPRQ